MKPEHNSGLMKVRIKIFIRGIVQGVGFRPFIFRLAVEMGITGFISNTSAGVIIEAEGEKTILDEFIIRIRNEKPVLSSIHSMEFSFLDRSGYSDFKIMPSIKSGEMEVLLMPDIAVCGDCQQELSDPTNRRYLYPFINCTNCGPRFSIIEAFPYDRINTSMKNFEMCEKCRDEYEDPGDRRFHAQPIACPDCGPSLKLLNSAGEVISIKGSAVTDTVNLIRKGKVIALKGLGGYQLIADALNDDAVNLIRQRKHREKKPFAIMTQNIAMTEDYCEVNEFEKRLLCSPESPVVLLRKKKGKEVAPGTAPGNPYLGIMHPYTPLHHLLLSSIQGPVIATSGNISEEPMCINETEAFSRLKNIADYFLVHDRGIIRAVDDSLVRVVKGQEMIIRRGRGYAPLPLNTEENSGNYIALGGQLKNTIALKKGCNIFISQHLGDLENKETEDHLLKTVSDLSEIYDIKPDYYIHDLHPAYTTTRIASEINTVKIAVQHHHAHAAACYNENQLSGTCLAVCWDGTGYGEDGTIWGGEFFTFNGEDFKRAASLKQFVIQGGNKGIKDIKKTAAGVFYDIYGINSLRKINSFNFLADCESIKNIIQLIEKNINCIRTSSIGRLIDAVAYLLNLSGYSNYEGESAMQLEFAAAPGIKERYFFNIAGNGIMIIDWHPVIEKILSDLKEGVPVNVISAKFHNTLIAFITTTAMIINEKKVLLTGGCFQNMYLLNGVIDKLRENNFQPYWHQRIPPNDGGISFGQAVYASAIIKKNKLTEV